MELFEPRKTNPMKLNYCLRASLILGLAAALAACQAGASENAPNVLEAYYTCDAGADFGVQFDQSAQTATLQFTDGSPITLPIARSGSGSAYSNGAETLRGKGKAATWTGKDGVALECQAK